MTNGLLCIKSSHLFLFIINEAWRKKGKQESTSYNQLQVEGILSGPVAGNACVNSSISASDRLDYQRMDSILSHQHFMGGIWTDGVAIQLPDQIGRG